MNSTMKNANGSIEEPLALFVFRSLRSTCRLYRQAERLKTLFRLKSVGNCRRGYCPVGTFVLIYV